jgi:alkanesulfonate monooxygenase SsuD/methylene tetrahydromethanopterin reductase-like flavin-dependent oxidoreductase (luciferase family)
VEIAQSIATLDQLTSGRAALGIGAGEAMNLIPFGIRWESPLIRLREAVEVIRKLFEATPQSPAEFHGSIFSLSRAYLQIRPYQKPRPPIYLGALGPKTRRMTGELADGWYPWIEAPETFREHLKDVYTGARSAGRNPEEIDAVAVFFSAISDNYEDAFKAVEQSAREALVLERSVSKLLGHEIQITKELTIQSLEAKEQHMRVLREAMMEVPKELVGEVTVIGTADECIKKIEEYIASGATSVAMYNLGPDAEYTFEAYAKDIIPYLKERYRP